MSRLGTALRILVRGEKQRDVSSVPDASGALQLSTTTRGAVPRKGTSELLQAYAEMPWLRALTHRIAYSIAVTEWKTFRPSRTPEKRTAQLKRMDFQKRRREIATLVKADELEELELRELEELEDDSDEVWRKLCSYWRKNS